MAERIGAARRNQLVGTAKKVAAYEVVRRCCGAAVAGIWSAIEFTFAPAPWRARARFNSVQLRGHFVLSACQIWPVSNWRRRGPTGERPVQTGAVGGASSQRGRR